MYRPAYQIAHYVACSLLNGLFSLDTYGAENLPKEGPFILASNHASFLDPVILGSAYNGPLSFVARSTLTANRFMPAVFKMTGVIPLDRDRGSDAGSVKQMVRVLRSGQPIALFPEGKRTRDGRLLPPKKGIGLLACLAAVPVVPARIIGSYEAWGAGQLFPKLGSRLSVVYGKPLLPQDYDNPSSGKARYELAATAIMTAIEGLVVNKRDVLI